MVEKTLLRLDFFNRHHLDVSQDLVGCTLVWNTVGGVITETEAYGAIGDDACHTASRTAAREFFEANSPGTVYAFMNYGIHWLLNVLAADGIVLIRAIEPAIGVPIMKRRRKSATVTNLCSGPGKLGQAIGLTQADHGSSLLTDRRHVLPRTAEFDPLQIAADCRIGISQAVDRPWRFLIPGHSHVSVPFGKAGTWTPKSRKRKPPDLPPEEIR